MSFFNSLSELIGEEYSVSLVVSKEGGQMSVSVLPTKNAEKDEAKQVLTPISLTGTPEQIDAGIIAALAAPFENLNQLVVSGQAFVKSSGSKAKAAETKEKKEEKKPAAQQTTLDMSAPAEKPAPKEKPKEQAKPAAPATPAAPAVPSEPSEPIETGSEMGDPDFEDEGATGDPAPDTTDAPAGAATGDDELMIDDADW